MLIKLAFFMGGLLFVLAWVGWRFFVAPLRPVADRANAGREFSQSAHDIRCNDAASDDSSRRIKVTRFLHWTVLGPVLVAAVMVGVVFLLSGRISLDPLQALNFQQGEHIQSALNPEKLVVPPALPPAMFMSTERPELATADRDWGRLDPAFVKIVLQVFERMQARGYPMALLEGYRSPERQDKLAASGAGVTNARAYQSKHQYGLAVDLAPIKDGHLQISERDPWAMQAYLALGEEAERAGLVWGGRWSFKDYGHVEVSGPISARVKK